MKILKIVIPEYTIHNEPDIELIGRKLDALLSSNFTGKDVLLRGVASSEHKSKPISELVETIRTTGTDRYNPSIAGDRYDNVDGKHIDIFAFDTKVDSRTRIFDQMIYGFYHSALGIHGRPMRIDIVTVYDAQKMERVLHRYEGRDDIKEDGFIFRQPHNRPDAILGIIQVL